MARFGFTAPDRNGTDILTGQTMTLADVEQGLASVAGPVTRTNIGTPTTVEPPPPPPPPSEDVSIVVRQSTAQIAPDSVEFSVEFGTNAFPSIPAPESGVVIDRRMHDLVYRWDFGADEEEDYTMPVNVLAEWKNRRYANGPWVVHSFRAPGAKTITVTVTDPVTRSNAVATTQILVRDADLFYSASNPYGFTGCATYVINPIGDTDWTGEPAGAIRHNADVLTSLPDVTGGPRRYLFKRGATFDFNVLFGSTAAPHLFIGAYGPGSTKPILNCPTGQKSIEFTGDYAQAFAPLPPDLRLDDIHLEGRFDPAVSQTIGNTQGGASNALWLGRSLWMLVSKCVIQGFQNATFRTFYNSASETSETTWHQHFDDSLVTNFGGNQYGGLWPATTRPNTSVSWTGMRYMQPVGAYSSGSESGDFDNFRANIRINSVGRIYIESCDWFTTGIGNSLVATQHAPVVQGRMTSVQHSSFEGNQDVLGLGGNSLNSNLVNMIVDGNIIVASYASRRTMGTQSSGLSLRNSLLIFPDAPWTQSFADFLQFKASATAISNAPAEYFSALNRIHNNTFIFNRPYLENGGQSTIPKLIDIQSTVPMNIVEENNVLQGEIAGQTGPGQSTPFAPLATTVLWAPRTAGYRDPVTMVLDASRASPAGTVASYAPLAGSPAIGTGGNRVMYDIRGNLRPIPASKGAWEVEA